MKYLLYTPITFRRNHVNSIISSVHTSVFSRPKRLSGSLFFFLNDTAPPEISPLPLHDPLPICLLGAKPPGLCVAANAPTTAVTGLSREEIVGKRLWDVVLPGTGRDLRTNWSTVLVVGALNGPCALRRRDGGSVAAEMYAAACILPDLHVAAIQTTS